MESGFLDGKPASVLPHICPWNGYFGMVERTVSASRPQYQTFSDAHAFERDQSTGQCPYTDSANYATIVDLQTLLFILATFGTKS